VSLNRINTPANFLPAARIGNNSVLGLLIVISKQWQQMLSITALFAISALALASSFTVMQRWRRKGRTEGFIRRKNIYAYIFNWLIINLSAPDFSSLCHISNKTSCKIWLMPISAACLKTNFFIKILSLERILFCCEYSSAVVGRDLRAPPQAPIAFVPVKIL
jgi:hypothetical protein